MSLWTGKHDHQKKWDPLPCPAAQPLLDCIFQLFPVPGRILNKPLGHRQTVTDSFLWVHLYVSFPDDLGMKPEQHEKPELGRFLHLGIGFSHMIHQETSQ